MSVRHPVDRAVLQSSVMVCERRPLWGPALRGRLASRRIRVVEGRSWEQCWEWLDQSPHGLLVLEATEANLNAVFDALSRIGHRWPRARVVVVVRDELARWRWLLREAGAAHIIHSAAQLDELSRIAVRQLARAPIRQVSLRERVWSRLPGW